MMGGRRASWKCMMRRLRLIKIKNMEKEPKLCMKEKGRKHRKENKQMEERFERARLILTRRGS